MAKSLARPLVILMVRAPVAGTIKTRLAASIGSAEALRFYRGTTASMIRRLGNDPRWKMVLAITPDRLCRARFWPSGMERWPQPNGGLGERMLRLLGGPVGRAAVLIGSDIPDIRASDIADALRKVGRTKLVLGPSKDGGFWLIGKSAWPLPRRLFDDVRFSTEHALADTVKNWNAPVDFVSSLSDVDSEMDYLAWRQGKPAGMARVDR
jgi:glycosyltransferase A (GT-A) superfamily protein (DUF2064 family)